MKTVIASAAASVALCFAALPRASAGICEQARIPLRTKDLGNGSSICVVPFCGEEDQKSVHWADGSQGSVTCMKCDQSPWAGTATDYREKSDVCPTALGTCDRGFCCPKKGTDTWYNENFGMDWKGMNTRPFITVTTYGGGTACGGTVAQAEEYLHANVPGEIDGIAAVPSQMYGSWISNMAPGSQQCYVNNNICYKVTDNNDKEWKIAVWGKCGGYVQCPGKELTAGDPGPEYYSQEVSVYDNAHWFDANRCINVAGVEIATGTSPDCMSVAGGDGTQQHGMNCCPHSCQTHVDWCGSNDHPHFDISETIYNEICGYSPCTVKKVEPYLCAWNPPKNPQVPDWSPRFSAPVQPGDPDAAPVHEPYPEPHCEDDTPTESPGSTPPPTPSVPDCDSVVTANLPELESCATPICTLYCDMMMDKVCHAEVDASACVNRGIQSNFCASDHTCSCTFAEA